ncbi:MAG: 2OG-Fe(II) oxygenase [Rickettsiales bacterium]
MSKRQWLTGDPVPTFTGRCSTNGPFQFDAAAGRYVVLCFFGSSLIEKNKRALEFLMSHQDFFDDDNACLFGVSVDIMDEKQGRVSQRIPGVRFYWDSDYTISRLYEAIDAGPTTPGEAFAYESFTLVLDPQLRVLAKISLRNLEHHNAMFSDIVAKLPPVATHGGGIVPAPVLVLPRVFEPEFCRRLIDIYKAEGGVESGFMRQVDGKTVGVLDSTYKKRKDCTIADSEIRKGIRIRMKRRLYPEIEKAFQFRATQMERYLVACYDSASGGYFRPHRDNTTKATEHRKFACTINLNAEEYEGGELRFPEFGMQTYRAPTGGAVIFSCSLLHEATPVTRGERYAFLPFIHDDASAELRIKNEVFLAEGMIRENEGANPEPSASPHAVSSPR